MYKVKPHFELPENIELPDCIYRQSPVNPTIKVSRSRPSSGTASGSGRLNVNGMLEPINMNCSSSNNTKAKAGSPGGGGGAGGKNKNKLLPSESNIGTTPIVSNSSSKIQLVSQDKIKAMEERQHALISRIATLHRTISTIHEQECLALAARSSRSNINLTRVASESDCSLSSDSENNLPEGDFVDIVINADPAKPPYSILFFYKLLQQVYGNGSIVVRALTHSSVTNANACQAAQAKSSSKAATYSNSKYLNAFNNNVEGIDSRKKRIILTVIWKKLNHNHGTELILSPLSQTMLYGEENIARFFSRILPGVNFPKLNYDGLEWDTLVRVDSFLDYAHLRSFDALESHLHVLKGGAGGSGGGKNRIGTVSEFLAGGKEPTIADFFMFSHTAHELLAAARGGGGAGVSVDKEPQPLLPLSKYSNIMKWLWACQNYGGFTVFEI